MFLKFSFEALNTLVAWLGFLLALITFAWNCFAHKQRIRLLLCIQAELADGFHFDCSAFDFDALSLLKSEVIERGCFALQIVNKSHFPVYIATYGFCQDSRLTYTRREAGSRLKLLNGLRDGKNFVANENLITPFVLQARESITIELFPLADHAYFVHDLLESGQRFVYAKTLENSVLLSPDCTEVFERLYRLI